MNNIAYIFLTLFFPIEGKGVPTPQEESRQTTLLLQQLDSTIKKIQQYDAAHEKNIEAIKQQLRRQKGGLKEEIVLTDKLIEAYSKFNYDSTILYINRNLQLAEQNGDQGIITRMKLRKAQYYAKTGSYLEAMSIIKKIEESQLPDSILPLFYDACRDVYGESGYYSHDQEINASYLDIAGRYRYLLQQYYSKLPESDIYLDLLETRARNQQDYAAALKYSDQRLEHIDSLSKKYSEVAYFRSLIYKGLGDKEKEKQWLIRSAIGDLRHSIKDQASLWTLANLLSEEGDFYKVYILNEWCDIESAYILKASVGVIKSAPIKADMLEEEEDKYFMFRVIKDGKYKDIVLIDEYDDEIRHGNYKIRRYTHDDVPVMEISNLEGTWMLRIPYNFDSYNMLNLLFGADKDNEFIDLFFTNMMVASGIPNGYYHQAIMLVTACYMQPELLSQGMFPDKQQRQFRKDVKLLRKMFLDWASERDKYVGSLPEPGEKEDYYRWKSEKVLAEKSDDIEKVMEE